MTIMQSAAGKAYLVMMILCAAGIGWFRYKGGLDASAALAVGVAMLAAVTMIYELAQGMRNKALTGRQFIGLALLMLAAWCVLAIVASGPRDSIYALPLHQVWSFWLLLATVAIGSAVQWWRNRREIDAATGA